MPANNFQVTINSVLINYDRFGPSKFVAPIATAVVKCPRANATDSIELATVFKFERGTACDIILEKRPIDKALRAGDMNFNVQIALVSKGNKFFGGLITDALGSAAGAAAFFGDTFKKIFGEIDLSKDASFLLGSEDFHIDLGESPTSKTVTFLAQEEYDYIDGNTAKKIAKGATIGEVELEFKWW